jgi:hypothetical protein
MIHVFVEGHGETLAVGKLIHRLWQNLELPNIPIRTPIRDSRIHTDLGLKKIVESSIPVNPSGLLIIRDSEDDCPKEVAPRISNFISEIDPKFPVAIVLMYREFETLFLSISHHLAGLELTYATKSKILLNPGFRIDFSPESKRDAKKELNDLFPGNMIYKPSIHQLPLTQLSKIEWLREAQLPCFGSLERALRHLAHPQPGKICYP